MTKVSYAKYRWFVAYRKELYAIGFGWVKNITDEIAHVDLMCDPQEISNPSASGSIVSAILGGVVGFLTFSLMEDRFEINAKVFLKDSTYFFVRTSDPEIIEGLQRFAARTFRFYAEDWKELK